MLLYKCIDEVPRFFPYLLRSCPVAELVVPMCFYMLEGRAHSTKLGVIYMCTFILLRLSGERPFAVALNEPFEVRIITISHININVHIYV